MAIPVVMPRQGNTVESCILVEWKKAPGDPIEEGEILCEVETDKAVIEVPSPASGTLLALFFEPGADIPVLTNIAAIGTPGEDVSDLRPDGASAPQPADEPADEPAGVGEPAAPAATTQQERAPAAPAQAPPAQSLLPHGAPASSPRARKLAASKNLDLTQVRGSGPAGRIIERDVQAALAQQPRLSPVAQAMVDKGGYAAPQQGSGPGGRIMARDLSAPEQPPVPTPAPFDEGAVETETLRGPRKVIAQRMLASLQTTAQLTLDSSADARSLQALRQRFKASDETFGLQAVTINDLVLFAVSRLLPQHPLLNAHFSDETIRRYSDVHLGFAVDTPRGLLVPVIRHANRRSLRDLAAESKRLARAAQDGSITPDEMNGGTFTVTNLGNLGIERFTPILNPPQVAILGVGSIDLKPVQVADDGNNHSSNQGVAFIPHIGLSLTINHQVVDGAPGARFLQALCQGLAQLDLLLAL